MRCSEQLESVLAVLLPLLDIIEAPVTTPEVPAWCRTRAWDRFLLGVTDEQLVLFESHGVGADWGLDAAPFSLVHLARHVRELTTLPTWSIEPRVLPDATVRGVRARKREQLSLLLGAVDRIACGSGRVVDVGAGSGHLTRMIAGVQGRSSLGIERDPARVAAARARLDPSVPGAAYQLADVDSTLRLEEGDLVVGLHACGSLSDQIVLAAARAQCSAFVVSCCYQKIKGEQRSPLSRAAVGFSLSRSALGLANLSSRPDGVESSLQENLAARERRYALRRLLQARGQELAAGAEMRGINRRQARGSYADLVARALALRGMAASTEPELLLHEQASRHEFARMRRLSLPRNLLSRLVEVALVLDRGAALEESGASVRVGCLFPPAVSPRNLGLWANFLRAEHSRIHE